MFMDSKETGGHVEAIASPCGTRFLSFNGAGRPTPGLSSPCELMECQRNARPQFDRARLAIGLGVPIVRAGALIMKMKRWGGREIADKAKLHTRHTSNSNNSTAPAATPQRRKTKPKQQSDPEHVTANKREEKGGDGAQGRVRAAVEGRER